MDNNQLDFLSVPPEISSFRVIEFENRYSQLEHADQTHELLYILDGRMTLHLSGNLKFQAVPGDLLIIPACTRHRDEFAPLKGLRILLVQFQWNAPEFFAKIDNRSLLALSYSVRTEVRRRLEFMRDQWINNPEGLLNAAIQMHGILVLFYFDLVLKNNVHAANSIMPMQEAMRRAKHFLDQNFAEQVSLQETAEHIGISPGYLSRVFHHEYGISFSKYLTALRLTHAVQLLQNHQLQIGEIALRCGFSSSSYFIKVFSEHFGVTPKNYNSSSANSKSMPILP